MKKLDGLWKDEDRGLLVQLCGSAMMSRRMNETGGVMAIIKATARIIKGELARGKLNVRLVPVLPKRDVMIYVVDAYMRDRPSMWNIEGVVNPTELGDILDRDEQI